MTPPRCPCAARCCGWPRPGWRPRSTLTTCTRSPGSAGWRWAARGSTGTGWPRCRRTTRPASGPAPPPPSPPWPGPSCWRRWWGCGRTATPRGTRVPSSGHHLPLFVVRVEAEAVFETAYILHVGPSTSTYLIACWYSLYKKWLNDVGN